MAFTTRSGHVVAIGRGAALTVISVWFASALLVWVQVIPASLLIAWFARPDWRRGLDGMLPGALGLAIDALVLLVMLRAFAVAFCFGMFIGPRNRLRDIGGCLARSSTVRLAAVSAILLVVLAVALRYPFGLPRVMLVICAPVALVVLDWFVLRGLKRIGRSNRAAAFFDGLTESQKRIADAPWPTFRRPSFPDSTALVSRADADRYARRADGIAQIHEWLGAGLILVFSAFVGTSILAMFTTDTSAPPLGLLVVFGGVAVGFWLQRRARTYRRLAESFRGPGRRRPRATISARGRRLRRESRSSART